MRVLFATGAMCPEPGGVPLPTAAGALDPGQVARALASGWARSRPDDATRLLPLSDGSWGAGSALSDGIVTGRYALPAYGPLGEESSVELVELSVAGGRSWLLDAAPLLGVPEDRSLAGRHAREGSTAGLGQVLAAACQVVPRTDRLIVTLARSAVHDGGAGLIEALGGPAAARDLLNEHEILIAGADSVTLGGMSGAGAGLERLTDLSDQEVAEADRHACAAASRIVADIRVTQGGASVPRPELTLAAGTSEPVSTTSWGSGLAGGSGMILAALGARLWPGARVMADLLDLPGAAAQADLVVTSGGEVFDLLADSPMAVAGEAAGACALPVVAVVGRALVPRGEWASAGLSAAYSLEEMLTLPAWDEGGSAAVLERLETVGTRLARTWSR